MLDHPYPILVLIALAVDPGLLLYLADKAYYIVTILFLVYNDKAAA